MKIHPAKQKTPAFAEVSFDGSGGRIRTYDLRVMSPTSCQTAPPRNWNTDYRGANPMPQPLMWIDYNGPGGWAQAFAGNPVLTPPSRWTIRSATRKALA